MRWPGRVYAHFKPITTTAPSTGVIARMHAGFFVVELVDAIHWILGSYHIRRLARAAAKYRPPICAIPGNALALWLASSIVHA
jgi:hypothetical protein